MQPIILVQHKRSTVSGKRVVYIHLPMVGILSKMPISYHFYNLIKKVGKDNCRVTKCNNNQNCYTLRIKISEEDKIKDYLKILCSETIVSAKMDYFRIESIDIKPKKQKEFALGQVAQPVF